MTALAYALGADVTAEGIETTEQLIWLQRIGIDHGQGFYFAPTRPPDAFVHRLNHTDQFLLSSVARTRIQSTGT
jgi:EAL domain-containing protein (putative c-di-GMP-specific phosphodiesterase class I)